MPAERLPYFPFYARDFLASSKVMAMSAQEVGCYTLLLCTAWGQEPVGTLPGDDETLSRLCRVSVETWTTIRGRVLAPFDLGTDGRWHQGRMIQEAALARGKYDRRAKAGREGGLAKSKQSPSNATPMPEQCLSNAQACASEYESGSVSSASGFNPETRDPPDNGDVLAKMGQWAEVCGTPILAHRNDYAKIRTGLLSWSQDKPVEDGKPVLWHVAVCRCIRAAQAGGVAFTSPAYAVRVISDRMAQFNRGIVPEQPTGNQKHSGASFDDQLKAEQEETMRRVDISLAERAAARAAAKLNGAKK